MQSEGGCMRAGGLALDRSEVGVERGRIRLV